ncbi:hypothetical protein SK128_003699, partial [Halocaridina rubra]
METTSPKVRALAGILIYTPWTIYTLVFSGLAYFVREWRWLMLGISLPNLLVLPALWYIDESVHWLVVRGEYGHALRILKKAAKWNKAELPPDEDIIYQFKEHNAEVQKTQKAEAKQTWKEYGMNIFILFRTPKLRTISLVMHLNFFVYGMVFYGLAFSGGSFNMDLFSYIALMGALELPGQILIPPTVSRIGRKKVYVVSFLLAGIMLLSTAVIPK